MLCTAKGPLLYAIRNPWGPICGLKMKKHYRKYESVLVPHSNLKCNSKFPVGMSKFPVQTRNFQLDKVEISSSNSKFPVGMSKFPVWRSRNFQFELEISSWTKWKFPVRTRNFQLECRNFQSEEVEISSSNSKFPVGMSKFPVWRSRNFQFELEISSSNYG